MIFIKVAPTRLNILWNYGIAHYNCHFYSHVGPVAFWNCIYILSKFVWVTDTLFIILRKKTLTPFRFFHHISLFVYFWYMYAERQGLAWLYILNSLTTSVFYGVPLLTSLIPSATRGAKSIYDICLTFGGKIRSINMLMFCLKFYDIFVTKKKKIVEISQILNKRATCFCIFE